MSLDHQKADVALIGLAVMGQNLILNMNDKGFKVCAFNRTVSKVKEFLDNQAKGTNVIGADNIQDMISKLKKPAKIILLVMAGNPVDSFIDSLIPFLSPGDIIIDGGNSDYLDTQRRYQMLKDKKIHFIGCGVSGGEEGARNGPSLMPGGSKEAWPHVKEIFQSIAAVAENSPCCDWVGNDGAGHYVKMVHNGIEYGDMQLIAEAYFLMKTYLKMSNDEMSQVFDKWNKEELCSYLIEITRDILKFKDEDGSYLVEKILDSAGQKGTGKWTVISSLQFGVPVTLIGEAVFARCLSSLTFQRDQCHKMIELKTIGSIPTLSAEEKASFLNDIKLALYASKIISYTQGFMLFNEASKSYSWDLDFARIAELWRGGCIIRSKFLNDISRAYRKDPGLGNLLLSDFFKGEIERAQLSWRKVVSTAVNHGIPIPAFSSAISFFDGIRSDYLPANLIQAQRDYFGAHTYELKGQTGKYLHTNWTGFGGDVTSSSYKR